MGAEEGVDEHEQGWDDRRTSTVARPLSASAPAITGTRPVTLPTQRLVHLPLGFRWPPSMSRAISCIDPSYTQRVSLFSATPCIVEQLADLSRDLVRGGNEASNPLRNLLYRGLIFLRTFVFSYGRAQLSCTLELVSACIRLPCLGHESPFQRALLQPAGTVSHGSCLTRCRSQALRYPSVHIPPAIRSHPHLRSPTHATRGMGQRAIYNQYKAASPSTHPSHAA